MFDTLALVHWGTDQEGASPACWSDHASLLFPAGHRIQLILIYQSSMIHLCFQAVIHLFGCRLKQTCCFSNINDQKYYFLSIVCSFLRLVLEDQVSSESYCSLKLEEDQRSFESTLEEDQMRSAIYTYFTVN